MHCVKRCEEWQNMITAMTELTDFGSRVLARDYGKSVEKISAIKMKQSYSMIKGFLQEH